MDPLSLVSLVTLVFQTVTILHNTLESIREAPDALSDLLSRTKSLQIMLHRLDNVRERLNPDRRQALNGMWDENRCRDTVETLHSLVLKIAFKKGEVFKGDGVLSRIQWVLRKCTAEKLAERLQVHKQDIISALVVLSL